MDKRMKKREFLTAGIAAAAGVVGIASALAQRPPMPAPGATYMRGPRPRRPVPHRMAKTTPLFKAPPGFPNALALMTDPPGGLWIGEQKMSGAQAIDFGVRSQKICVKQLG